MKWKYKENLYFIKFDKYQCNNYQYYLILELCSIKSFYHILEYFSTGLVIKKQIYVYYKLLNKL